LDVKYHIIPVPRAGKITVFNQFLLASIKALETEDETTLNSSSAEDPTDTT